jgi:septal ring factor EnvC (AmiA/AmiB activator)
MDICERKDAFRVKLSFVTRIFISTTIISVLFFVVPRHNDSASEKETKKKQITEIEKELSREKEKFLKFGIKEKNLLGQLSTLEKSIDEKKGLLESLKRKISLSKRDLIVQQKKLNQSELALRRIEDRLNKRLVAFYKYAKRGYMQLLATSAGLVDFRKRTKYLKVIMDEDLRLFEKMVAIQLSNKKEMLRITEKIAAIDQLEQTERERLKSIEKDLDTKVIFLMKIHQEKEFYATVVEELQLAAKDLKKTLLNLDKKPEKSKKLPTGFAKLKGKLPLPVKGRVIKGKTAMGTGLKDTHKGIYIGGPIGAEVKAIYPGRVDFSGWLKGYGQIIVINHGSRFFTLSAHLSHREKEKGEMVKKGEVIGLLGQTESLEGPRLYFEIRRRGDTLDPFSWLKAN